MEFEGLNTISPQQNPAESSGRSSRLIPAAEVDPKRLKTIGVFCSGGDRFEGQTFTHTLRRVNRNRQAGPLRELSRDVSGALPKLVQFPQAGGVAAAVTNLWLRVSCSQQKRPWMAFLRSTQYLGTDAGVERAGGMALGSEKGHQLPLVVCCCGA